MKRIDDKIKEIKEKDKRYNWAYYIIVALLIGFIYYASTTRKQMEIQADQIDALIIKETQTYKEIDSLNKHNKKLYDDLKSSLRPEEYWSHIENENSTEGYISYITNDWGIDKTDYLSKAYDKLLLTNNSLVTYDGWIWVGSKKRSDNIYKSKDYIKILSKKDGSPVNENDEPQKGDIIQLKTPTNRNTYQKNTCKGSKNDYGWRNKTKAIVVEVYHVPTKTDFNIRIKYY